MQMLRQKLWKTIYLAKGRHTIPPTRSGFPKFEKLAIIFFKCKPLPAKNLPLKLHHLLWDAWIMGQRYFFNLLAWGAVVFRLFSVPLCPQPSVPWNGKNLITNTLVSAAERLFYTLSLEFIIWSFVPLFY